MDSQSLDFGDGRLDTLLPYFANIEQSVIGLR